MLPIMAHLETGAANAKTGRELATALGVTCREVSAAIEAARRQGAPICASCDAATPGYFLAEHQAEMQRYCNSLYHRAGEIFKTRAACLATIDDLPPGPDNLEV